MGRIRYDQSETVWQQQMSEKILRLTKDDLYMDHKFLSIALSAFIYRADERLVTLATDGQYLNYKSERIISAFEDNPVYLRRTYLHSVFHCLFSHLWTGTDTDRYLWGIACDIAVEYTIDHIGALGTRRIQSLIRRGMYDKIENGGVAPSAAAIYRYISGESEEKIKALHDEFFADDHVFWPKDDKLSKDQVMLKNTWADISQKTTRQKRWSADSDTDDDADILSYQIRAGWKKRNYKKFLESFMVMHEQMHTDPDEFDIGYYMYGLSLYGDLPLIEPVETKEIRRICDFVIVIDTSYSTNGELVRKFLDETFSIIKGKDNFFRKSKLHIIQADDKVRSDTVLEGEHEFERYSVDFEITGGGSTDFRPAFTYIKKLLDGGEFENLCGILYFTDGRGIYPTKDPGIKTAFVFMDDYVADKVPPWAMQTAI